MTIKTEARYCLQIRQDKIDKFTYKSKLATISKYDLYDFDPGYEIISEMREEALAAKERKYNEKKELEKARRKHYASIIGTMTSLAIKNGLYF